MVQKMNKSKLYLEGGKKISATAHVKHVVLMMLLIIFLAPLDALAGKGGHNYQEKDRFVLDFDDSYVRGNRHEPNTLYLKKMLRQQYPWLNVSDYRLRKVVVVAKTQYGRGKVQLRVGPEASDLYRVSGRPDYFQSYHKRSFDKVRIHNPFYESWGPWQLFMRGKFKIRKIVLFVEKREHNQYGWWPYNGYYHDHYNWRSSDGKIYFKMRW